MTATGTFLYERCGSCDAAELDEKDRDATCPECKGERFVPIGMTIEEFEIAMGQIDPLRSAVLAAVPLLRRLIESSEWSRTGLSPDEHPVLANLNSALNRRIHTRERTATIPIQE